MNLRIISLGDELRGKKYAYQGSGDDGGGGGDGGDILNGIGMLMFRAFGDIYYTQVAR